MNNNNSNTTSISTTLKIKTVILLHPHNHNLPLSHINYSTWNNSTNPYYKHTRSFHKTTKSWPPNYSTTYNPSKTHYTNIMIHKRTNSIEIYYWLKKISHTCPYSISYHLHRLNLIIKLLHWFMTIRIDSIKSKTNSLLISNESLLIFLHLYSGRISLYLNIYKLIWMKIIKTMTITLKITLC